MRTGCAAAAGAILLTVGCNSSGPPTGPSGTVLPPPGSVGCARTATGMIPLTDLRATYLGYPGGLYPAGNSRPAAHESAGAALARSIEPLDAAGVPDPAGRYAFISIGMSNTTQEFSAFVPIARNDPDRDSRLVIVDGAQGGQTAADWASPSCQCWTRLDGRLQAAGITPLQVAVAWVKLANRQPTGPFPDHALALKNDTASVLQALKDRFPNLRLVYLSSRIYAGYATTPLNPEPYAYESAFSMRWVIEDQLRGDPALNFDAARGAVRAPWLSWGPYLWADGLAPRSDGLIWTCDDLQSDGTHPSATGEAKVADLLLRFVRTDATAREWFLR